MTPCDIISDMRPGEKRGAGKSCRAFVLSVLIPMNRTQLPRRRVKNAGCTPRNGSNMVGKRAIVRLLYDEIEILLL